MRKKVAKKTPAKRLAKKLSKKVSKKKVSKKLSKRYEKIKPIETQGVSFSSSTPSERLAQFLETVSRTRFHSQEKKATRDAYGETLLALGKKNPNIVVLDADLSGSTKTCLFAKEFPNRFFNVGVAEQNLVGLAAGFALSGLIPVASSFAVFLSGRAWEIVRNSVAYPGLNVKLVASHAGLTVGEDGASHQCLEDISLMRSLPGMNVFVPSDYHETKAVIQRVLSLKGPCYVRCGRMAVPVLSHPPGYRFHEGQGELRRAGKHLLIIACGVMVHEADKAASILAKHKIEAAVINQASIKPLDEKLIIRHAKKTGAVLTLEEHNVIGGLGSAVAELLSSSVPMPLIRVGVRDVWGQSGTGQELLDHYGLNLHGILEAADRLLNMK